MNCVGDTLEKLVQDLKYIFNITAKNAARVMKDAQYTAEDVERAIRKVYNAPDGVVADALDYAGYSAKEIENSLIKDQGTRTY
ncbi:hypothetical protein R9X47_10015 [Wukongibacter baidiensis]|uniref:hypothetical protein n=1 Tax=Wukongibacter baidiensis TaxID=1723361 RepID=UPI003D7FBF5F